MGPDWIRKWVYNSSVIKLDINKQACFYWWIVKNMGILMSSTPLFRKEILQILGASPLALNIVGLNILDSVISRVNEHHWKNIEFLSLSKLSWRRTAVF